MLPPPGDEKPNRKTCETVKLLCWHRSPAEAWLIYEQEPLLPLLDSSLFPLLSAVSRTCAPLRGGVARLPVSVRLCMNQSGDRAAGRMADAAVGRLFNQAALPSRGQGETPRRQMKKPRTLNLKVPHTHIRRKKRLILIPLVSQRVTPPRDEG